MATWKKVVVSGSQAELNTLALDSTFTTNADTFQFTGSVRISGSTIITGSVNISGSLFATASNAVSSSYALTASYALNAIASNFSLTNGEGVSPFTFNGSSAQTVSVSGAADLTQNIITKWDNVANKFANSSLTDNGTTISGTTSIVLTGANSSLSGSLLGTSSFASVASASFITDTTSGTGPYYLTFVDGTTGNRPIRVDSNTLTFNASTNVLTATASFAEKVANSLTLGDGLTGAAYNGSAAITAAVGAGALISVSADAVQVATSSLTTNQIPKLGTNTLAGSNITDTGTQVQIGSSATSGLSVAAGGVTVTGNSTFNSNLTVAGDLTVAGTASFQNTQNLLIADRFAAFASGSTTLTDGGIIVISSTSAAGMSGSAFYLDAGSTGTYGRFAVAYNVHASASSVNPDEFAVTAKTQQASNPSAAPTWGGASNGEGNMWITTAGEIFIYS